MLEFKNASVALSADRVSAPFSLEMDAGEVACLSGAAEAGKSLLLRAIMGLAPLRSGYITIDGELVTPGSSAYFRRMIAYVPQRVPTVRVRVGQLITQLLSLKAVGVSLDQRQLSATWQAMALPADLAERWATDVEPRQLATALLAAVPLLRRPIVLVDDPAPEAVAAGLLADLAASGAEVLYTSRRSDLPCHKIITL